MDTNLPFYVFEIIEKKLGSEKALVVDQNWDHYANSCFHFSSATAGQMIKEAKLVLECVTQYGSKAA